MSNLELREQIAKEIEAYAKTQEKTMQSHRKYDNRRRLEGDAQ